MALTCARALPCALAVMMATIQASALQLQHAILTESGSVELGESELDAAAQSGVAQRQQRSTRAELRWRDTSLLRPPEPRLNASPVANSTSTAQLTLQATAPVSDSSRQSSQPQLEMRSAQASTGSSSIYGPVKGRSSRPTLFCFALTLSTGNEPKLLAYHFEKGLGIFGCDGYAIYSNVTSDKFSSPMPRNLTISVLNETMETGFVPLWDGLHSLNSHVFEMVWRRVYSDAAFRHYDWIVKVDLDTVVNHAHLRRLLSAQDQTRAMYLQNVDLGWFWFLFQWLSLHGAIEVLSVKAVETYVNWLNFCNFFMPVPAGEDVFLAGCMTILGVPGVYEGNLLKEYGGCDCSFGALHPFKQVEVFAACERKCAGS